MGLALAGLLAVSVISSSPRAFSQGYGDEVTGKYFNSKYGVEVTFPSGWEGYESFSEGLAMVVMARGDADRIMYSDLSTARTEMMMLVVMDRLGMGIRDVEGLPALFSDGLMADRMPSETDCSDYSVDSRFVSGHEGAGMVMKCTIDGRDIVMRAVVAMPGKSRMVMLYYAAVPSSLDMGQTEFDRVVQTLKVAKVTSTSFTILATGVAAIDGDAGGLASGDHTVTIMITGDYSVDRSRVKVDKKSLSGTLAISGVTGSEDLRIQRIKVSTDMKRVEIKAKGETATVTAKLFFPSAVDYRNGAGPVEGDSQLRLKATSFALDTKKTGNGRIIFEGGVPLATAKTAVAKTTSEPETGTPAIQISSARIWVRQGSSVAAFVVENTGGATVKVTGITIRGVAVPDSSWYYNKLHANSAARLVPDFSPAAVNIDAYSGEEPFIAGAPSLEKGQRAVIYLVNPAYITGADAGLYFNVRVQAEGVVASQLVGVEAV
jgi:hypothetical protein